MAEGLAGLDRKAMEAERLARIANRKRERSISPPPPRNSRKAPKMEPGIGSFSTLVNQEQQGRKSEIANAATQQLRSSHDLNVDEPAKSDLQASTASNVPQPTLQYPRGVIKKTWAFKFDRTGNDIKLEEVLEPRTLRTAVLSAFQWDTEWVLSKLKTPLNGGITKCVFVMQGDTAELREQMLKQTEDMRHFLRLCFPSMEGQIHCMHSKLMLLFHPDKLRIAIPTANLLNFDWGETGVMENSVFLIDLPRNSGSAKTDIDDLTHFGKELMFYLEKQGLDQDVRNGVLNFDFSATQDMTFVHTAGGIHWGQDADRTGLFGLSRAVRQLNLQTDDNLQIDFAASSIGSLNDVFLKTVHSAARGVDIKEYREEAMAKTKADFFKPSSQKAPAGSSNIRDQLRIYFPTHETVSSSIAGAAGTICLSRKWFEASTFPRSCFRDYRSTRTGLLSHNKILYARGQHVAWAYVGSANMSESAWGKMVYDKKQKAWKINCRNWECGVLLPVPADKVKKSSSGEDVAAMTVFNDVVLPPFEVPGKAYDGREPWYFQEFKEV